MPTPEVILIGGPPGAGKTSLGRALAAHLGYASVTGDDLATAARAVADPTAHPELSLMRGIGHQRYFTETPPEIQIADAGRLEETMWPIIERVVATHLREGDPIVIDWWLLSPRRVADLREPRVGSLWLHIDHHALEERERSNADFWEGSAHPETMFASFMARSLWRNSLVADEASTLGLPVLHQSGHASVDDLVAAAKCSW